MTAKPVAIVDWSPAGCDLPWEYTVTGWTPAGAVSGEAAMRLAGYLVDGGPLRWEHAGPHRFEGYAAERELRLTTITREQYDDAVRCASMVDVRSVAPATIIDPADDPTPDDWGSDPEPAPEPPNAEPARRADADHAFEELRKGDNVRRCTEPGCNRKHQARGLCDRHYARAKAAGALPPRGTAPRPSEQRPSVAPKDPNRIAYGAAMAPARAKPGVTAESLGYAAGAPIRWPEDWTTTPDPELGRIAAAALARCSGDKREARKYLGAAQPAFDRALKIARDLGLT